MNCIEFNDIRFAYPPVPDDTDENGNQLVPAPVFDHFTAALPEGFVSLVGPNAAGKSTFMLLAAGRMLPQQGTVSLFGKNTARLSEAERDALASFIYQNMEFETDDTAGNLLAYVFTHGLFGGSAAAVGNGKIAGASDETAPDISANGGDSLLEQIVSVLELGSVLHRKLTGLSKGEMQRVIIAFALLYGSKSIFMDEPLFALEDRQKRTALAYLKKYAATFGVTVYISMHVLELSRAYADSVLLFYPNRDMDFGTPEEVLTPEALEKAYGVPAAMLKDSEALTRKTLKEQAEAISRLPHEH
ncbi:ABC transporter ATP-binding protein [Treponema brennaborense]|uniref:ABC transporter related protein n=1 Tax=Treponema brennaborense (strain DSM 12168 / CIP 105900 / DD5/3) TaxID=906968 RepID=F4LMB5_TREBD|nr:ABC transporter ATP-binding protein [Treponema brennaborense]AEE17781.1 ABC transporter related protein [Treponema brennaborense DSM 12168]